MMRNGRPIGVLSWKTNRVGIITSWEAIWLRAFDQRWALLMGPDGGDN